MKQKLGLGQVGDIKDDKPPPPKDEPPKDAPALPGPLSETPVPGVSYRINPDDATALLILSQKTYGTKGGTSENLKAAQLINNHPYNKRFQVVVENEKNLFPPEGRRISFTPMFGTLEQQLADPAQGARGQGQQFAVLYLPPKPEKW